MSRQNQKRGSNFEKWCAHRPEELGLDVFMKWIDRTSFANRFVSNFDIELPDFPHLAIDAKFTVGSFSISEKKKLCKDANKKYLSSQISNVWVIIGERFEKSRMNYENVLAATIQDNDPVETLQMIPYDDFLNQLHFYKNTVLLRKGL